MKTFKLLSGIFLLLFLFSSCTSKEQQAFMDARTVLAYPDGEMMAEDSEVAILVVPRAYGLKIDDLQVILADGSVNPNLRISKIRTRDQIRYMYAVEMLPGAHQLTVFLDGDEAKTLERNYDFQAGDVYFLELNKKGDERSILIAILKGDYRNFILESRAKAEF